MCVYTGYATASTTIQTFFFLIVIIKFTVWLKHSLPTAIFYNWPTPKFQPLCYHRLKNLCMKIKKKTCWFHENLKTCWFHDNWKLVDFTLKPFVWVCDKMVSMWNQQVFNCHETILSHTHTKGFTINIMFMFMRSLFFTHLFVALAEMFECPNLFPQYALCSSTSSFKVEVPESWSHCSLTCPWEQGWNTILIAIVRCLMGMLSRLLEMEFQSTSVLVKENDCV